MDEDFNPDKLLKDIDAILDSNGISNTIASPVAPVEIEADPDALLKKKTEDAIRIN